MNMYIAVMACIVLITLFILLIKIRKKNKRQKIMTIQAEDKLREETLDKIILNDKAQNDEGDVFSAKPFEVNYDAASVEKHTEKTSKDKYKTMVQIVENSELSSRKYMFDPSKGIHIGGKIGKNDIVVSDMSVDDQQCEIVLSSATVYIRNLGGSCKVVLKRGKQQAYVEKKYVEMKSNDMILIGKTIFRIEIIMANTK